MQSLAAALTHVGKKSPFSVRNDFQTYPKSLREMMRIMNLPKPDLGQLKNRRVYEFSVDDAQGLTYATGDTWYLTSQWKLFQFWIEGQDIYRPTAIRQVKSIHLHELINAAGLNKNDYDHIGDVDCFQDMLFVPIRRKGNTPPHLLFGLSKDLEVVSFADVVESSDSWCTINPWNRALYMPDDKDSHCLNAYDVSSFLDILPRRNEWGHRQVLNRLKNKSFTLRKEDGSIDTSGGFQGCFFSANGRMYLPRAASYTWGWRNYLHVYETLTGVRLNVSQEYDFPSTWDEIEGISIHPSGVIYIAVADNDEIGTDEFWVYAFRFSNSNMPV